MLGSFSSSPVVRRRALGVGATIYIIGAGGYVALRYASKTGGEGVQDAGDGLADLKGLLRRLRSLAATRVPAARVSTAPTIEARGHGVALPPRINSYVSILQSPVEPAMSAFSSWVKGPLMELSQLPLAYFRASLVNGGSSVRISAANHVIDAAMVNAETLFAQSFAGSASAYTAMVSELTAQRTSGANAWEGEDRGERGRREIDAAAAAAAAPEKTEASERASVKEFMAASAKFVMAAQAAAITSDAALVIAIDEVREAMMAVVGVAGALHAAKRRTPPRAESSGSVAGLLHDFAVEKATLKGSQNSTQVAKQGLVAWRKAQTARKRIRELSAHVKVVVAASRYAERALKMEMMEEALAGRGKRGRGEDAAVLALHRLHDAVEGAIACSQGDNNR